MATYKDLVKKILNELLLQRSACEQPMKISSEQFCNKVDILQRAYKNIGEGDDVFVPDMLEQFEFPVSPLGKDGSAEWLHNLFDGHAGISELIFGAAYQAKCTHSDRLEVDVTGRDFKDAAKEWKKA